ncbi:MAG: hemerythrin domain-containing protein [Sneathiella sp.]
MQINDHHAKELINEIPRTLLANPLTYIKRQHERNVSVCHYYQDNDVFCAMCEGDAPKTLLSLHHFLTQQLPRHMRDEQEGLFPLLKAFQSKASRGAQEYINIATREQEFDKDIIEFVLADLDVLLRSRTLVNPLRLELNLQTLLEGLASHANWEIQTILPLAETLLSEEALAILSSKMEAWRLN